MYKRQTVGCAIGSGSDIAIESADIVLMRSDLQDVPRAIRLSRLTLRDIKQNLFWAFCYNTIGIPIAAGLLFAFGGPLLLSLIHILYQGALAGDGQPRIVEGDLKTIMAGLACGEPNILSWDILRNHVSAFVSCPDWVSARGMRMLGVPVKGDPTVISGESGAVGMGLIAALMETDEYQDLREAIGLDRFSQVLLFSTEGNTDPMKFRKVLWDGEYPTV